MWTIAVLPHVINVTSTMKHSPPPSLDHVMLFGFLSTFFTAVFFIYQHESRAAMRMFAACLALTGVYGLLQGSIVLGMIVLLWSITAFRQSFRAWHPTRNIVQTQYAVELKTMFHSKSRVSRLFGSTYIRSDQTGPSAQIDSFFEN